MKFPQLLTFLILALSQSTLHADVIALYTFNDGTAMDSTGNFNLTTTGTGITYDLAGFASFPGVDGSLAYLDTVGPGDALTEWTVSVWYRPTGGVETVANQGIFSNDNSFTEADSFQLAIDNGVREVNAVNTGVRNFGAPTNTTWENIVLRKASDSDFRIYLNGVQQGTLVNGNIGGLERIRIGTNRAGNSGLRMDVDEVQIWNTAEDAAAIFAAGPTPVPEPSSILFLALSSCGGFLLRKRLSTT